MIRRESKQREAILNVLRHTDSHPTADWVYDEIRKVITNISKGTVYRNLKILRKAGEISELNLSGTVSRYEGGPENHYHFRCEKCGRVFDLEESVNKELDERVAIKPASRSHTINLSFAGSVRIVNKNKNGEKGEI